MALSEAVKKLGRVTPLRFGAPLRVFSCVICGQQSRYDLIDREGMTCDKCGATWRARAMVLALLQSLGMTDTVLSAANEDWSIRGIGISDDIKIASKLASKFLYTNTYYHQSPKLDLCAVDEQWLGSCRFVICSDVLEHVPGPIEKALHGLYSVLQNGGVAVISVPYKVIGTTNEFYPGLVAYELFDGSVVWYDTHGEKHLDLSPEFHGGEGQTLAFRVFSMSDLLRLLKLSGFSHVVEMKFDEALGVPPLGSRELNPYSHCDVVLIAYK